jgi:hypothetical protein
MALSACSKPADAPTANPIQPSPAPAAKALPSTQPDVLSVYVGHHPSEKVGGKTFLEQTTVKYAVDSAVSDDRARDFVFHYNGPDAPIVKKDGRVLAWGCEAHNCGYHNWAVSITPDGGSAEICFYQNDAKPDGQSTWYKAGAKPEQRAGNCPSE